MKPSRGLLNKIHNIGVTIQPEINDSDPNFEQSEDLYGSDLDDSDDQYVNDNFREGDKSTDAVLCCAMCFTPVSYQCKLKKNSFVSKSVVNLFDDDATDDSSKMASSEDVMVTPDSNKRRMRKKLINEKRTAKCVECNNIVAHIDESNNYIFKDVIASKP
ncbi:conserved hypothetical protein [Theileria orientalis strain Shintoku]|uniref:E2F-associated phosphoprotein n=1 Tax=Theileria orientalis strain Shintoku TaxID=869250 RepID=J4DNS7_THEOR|nr:conserved hypothetical protein [Theileria orientalis strain Shintoku]BAM39479.1 conserved hypothetical protein [Theileria orientalis strain Shintoku]|eukprot:XP_009689780.1 conserved hypothetical protein [Theileria orientalis strain Shintoku]